MTIMQSIEIHAQLKPWLKDIRTDAVMRQHPCGWQTMAIRVCGIFEFKEPGGAIVAHLIDVEGWDETDVVYEANTLRAEISGVLKPQRDVNIDEIGDIELLL